MLGNEDTSSTGEGDQVLAASSIVVNGELSETHRVRSRGDGKRGVEKVGRGEVRRGEGEAFCDL